MRVSEIRVNQIRVNQGLGVYEKCKVFTCSYACNLHVIIGSVARNAFKNLSTKEVMILSS